MSLTVKFVKINFQTKQQLFEMCVCVWMFLTISNIHRVFKLIGLFEPWQLA